MIRQTPANTGAARPAASLAIATVLALGACGETTPALDVNTLNGPSGIAFSCLGNLRVTADGPGTAEIGDVIWSPMPVDSCAQWNVGMVPEGQEGDGNPDGGVSVVPTPPTLLAFILQTTAGSVALAYLPADAPLGPSLRDPDYLTPGRNTIPMGSLPIGIAADPSGCHVTTANAGSCDLATLDVASAYNSDERPVVRRSPIVNANGDAVGARPRAMVGDPRPGVIGVECADEPDSLIYIAYPDCNMVTAVHSGSGQVVAGIAFRDDGTIEITDGDVGCAAECGTIVAPPGSAARPVSLHLDGAHQRLYVGFEDTPTLVIVELDGDLMPVSTSSVALEGEVGLTAINVSHEISMGAAGGFRFAYGVATDGTVRVIEVDHLFAECDTQVDTRYLHDERDISFLPCMPVGDARTPPRRLGARSPGIHIPGDGLPLSVEFVEMDNTSVEDANTEPAPLKLDGVFAFITISTGRLVLVNIDDERYPEAEPEISSEAVNIALALPHRIRDFGSNRGQILDSCQPVDPILTRFMPRMEGSLVQTSDDLIASNKRHLLPSFRQILCVETLTDDNGEIIGEESVPIPEMRVMPSAADVVGQVTIGIDDKQSVFPDFTSVSMEEGWLISWEGPISLDGYDQAISGPPIRAGFIDVGAQVTLGDGAAPFCRMGVEPYDILILDGCDPTQGDSQCGVGKTCYVHENTPASVGSGMCLPVDRAEELATTCGDLLTSRRRYTVEAVHGDHLVLGERRRALRTTPLAGCASNEHCDELYEIERELISTEHPVGISLEEPEQQYSWSCEADPSRALGPPRCLMTCAAREDCEEGYLCSSGYCVAGDLPAPECVQGVQRYHARVGEAFSVVGSASGFLHNRILDEGTGECIDDPNGHPLAVGRLPLSAPPCAGDGITDILPNPCSTTVEHFEVVKQWEVVDEGGTQTCREVEDSEAVTSRQAEAIRFRNPVFTFHMVDPETTGDAQCNGDGAGTRGPYRTTFPGHDVLLSVVGGLYPAMLTTKLFERPIAYPVDIELGPYGSLWIMDQGDRTSSVRGQVVWFSPAGPFGDIFDGGTARDYRDYTTEFFNYLR